MRCTDFMIRADYCSQFSVQLHAISQNISVHINNIHMRNGILQYAFIEKTFSIILLQKQNSIIVYTTITLQYNAHRLFVLQK